SRFPARHTSPLAQCMAVLFVFLSSPACAVDSAAADDTANWSAFKPGLVYGGAAFANLGGGVRPGGTLTSNLNLQLTVDAAALLGWPDTITYADVLWLQGGLPSNFIGDAQG